MVFRQILLVGWLVVFNVPSKARSFRDGTPIYCPLGRTWSSIDTPFQPGIEPRAVAWQSITLPLRYASSTDKFSSIMRSSCGRADSLMDLHTTGPRFKTRWVRYTSYRTSDWLPSYQYKVELSLVCVKGQGKISRSGLTQISKMGSCVFQCDVLHQ